MASIKDQWYAKDKATGETIETAVYGRKEGRYRARYRDDGGKEYARHFNRMTDAQAWLNSQTAALENGTHVSPRHDKLTVAGWCDVWFAHYNPPADATKVQAAVDIRRIKAGLGEKQLRHLKAMHVEKWLGDLRRTGSSTGGPLEDSTVYATYRRLVQILKAAVKNGRLGSMVPALPDKGPSMGTRRSYVAEADQIWALADAFPDHLRLAVLLGAFAGLRNGELCGLRIEDVNPMRGEIWPKTQHGGKPLKTDGSTAMIAIPRWLADEITDHIAAGYAGEEFLLRNEWGDPAAPWLLQRAMRRARKAVPELPEGFRLHDCRHYLASTLIDKGTGLTVVQAQMRHASLSTTTRVYAHLMQGAAEKARAALEDEYRPRVEKAASRESS